MYARDSHEKYGMLLDVLLSRGVAGKRVLLLVNTKQEAGMLEEFLERDAARWAEEFLERNAARWADEKRWAEEFLVRDAARWADEKEQSLHAGVAWEQPREQALKTLKNGSRVHRRVCPRHRHS